MSALSHGLTQRCGSCGRIGRQNRQEDGRVVCLPCYSDEHACDVCGDEQRKRRVVGPAERERLPDLARYVEVICDNCWRVRLQVREREVIAQSYRERAEQRGRGRR
jgi:hypothetical protein